MVPLKLPKPYHYEIFFYNLLLTPLLGVLLSEPVYYNLYVNQRSCAHVGIVVLIWLVLHILDIHQFIFDYVHLRMHAKGSMWPF